MPLNERSATPENERSATLDRRISDSGTRSLTAIRANFGMARRVL